MEPRHKHLVVADVDGTVLKKFHVNPFIENVLRLNLDEFWHEVGTRQRTLPGYSDKTVLFLSMLLYLGEKKLGRQLRREEFVESGQDLPKLYYPGIPNFFNEIKEDYPDRLFYTGVNTSGITPIIEGSTLGQSLDFICGYDFLIEDGVIVGISGSCSASEKGALFSQISKGRSKRKGVHEWPLSDAFYFFDGQTDRSFARVGQIYGAYGIIILEKLADPRKQKKAQAYAAKLKADNFGQVICYNDFRRGHAVRTTMDERFRAVDRRMRE